MSTPIGNLADLTSRAAACLAAADLVLCEDTRVTAKLLSALGVSAKTEALHDHNEQSRTPSLLDMLERGSLIALVSDAGTPLVSDPGYRLVRAAIARGIPVIAIPGANAALTALTVSGLPPHPFLFMGFAPPRRAARLAAFKTLYAAEQAGLSVTSIWYEAPHRLADMLADLASVFSDARAGVVARELTKRFEEVRRGTIGELHALFTAVAARGEITVLVGPGEPSRASKSALDDNLAAALRDHSVRDAASMVAEATNLPKREVYARALQLQVRQAHSGLPAIPGRDPEQT